MPPAPRLPPSSSLAFPARRAATPPPRSPLPACLRRQLHASRPQQQQRRHHQGGAAADHYARLGVRRDASPAEIKRSFYALSKTHHPDVNPSDPDAAHSFSLLSESYTLLSDPSRRAAYDRHVFGLEHHARAGSYSSTAAANPAGGRSPSGLSRRRGSFRGPAPSFFRNGGWGAHADARRRAHEESTGVHQCSGHRAHDAAGDAGPRHAGMGPGSSPFGHADEGPPPHFDRRAHARTHETEDRRRWQRSRRAIGDDDVEFEPQTSIAGHFLIVAGILGATFLAPVVYLQFMRLGRRRREQE